MKRMRSLVELGLLVALVACLTAAFQQPPSAQDVLAQSPEEIAAGEAVAAYRHGRLDVCLDRCDSILATAPTHLLALQYKGMALDGLDRHPQASVVYQRALDSVTGTLAPALYANRLSRIRIQLAVSLLEQRQYKRSLKVLEGVGPSENLFGGTSSLRLYAECYALKAVAQAGLGKLAEAYSSNQQAISFASMPDPDDPLTLVSSRTPKVPEILHKHDVLLEQSTGGEAREADFGTDEQTLPHPGACPICEKELKR